MRVKAQCCKEGWFFEANGRHLGPRSSKELDLTDSLDKISNELGVEVRESLWAMHLEHERPIKLSELEENLSSTVKRDVEAKLITFLGMLLAQTDEDQYNIAFQAESSTGKSYIPLELMEYFPESERREYAGASPTSFYHQIGKWLPLQEVAKALDVGGLFDLSELADEKRKVILVNLESKILLFLDQPHWMLMERLRPLLSHDKKALRYDITDKTGKGGLRTKTVLIIGFPTVIFCTTKPSQEDQERTRLWLLSPESSQEKLKESLNLIAKKESDRAAFKEMIGKDPMRLWLMRRIGLIRETGIKNVVIPNEDQILRRFLSKRNYLKPRDQRDLPRLLRLIKAIALLNCFHRKEGHSGSIVASDEDTDEAFELYDKVAVSNELGLAPEAYDVYEKVIRPLASNEGGASRKAICKRFFEIFHRPLQDDRLRRQILPALESAGLTIEEPDPDDRRNKLVYCTVLSPISVIPEGDAGGNGPQKYRGRNSAPPTSGDGKSSSNLPASADIIANLPALVRKGNREDFTAAIAKLGMAGPAAKALFDRLVNDGALIEDGDGTYGWKQGLRFSEG